MRELTDLKRIQILGMVNHRLVEDLQRVRDIAKGSLDYCEKNKFRRSKRMERILDLVNGTLFYLDNRKCDLESLLKEIPKEQMRLAEVEIHAE